MGKGSPEMSRFASRVLQGLHRRLTTIFANHKKTDYVSETCLRSILPWLTLAHVGSLITDAQRKENLRLNLTTLLETDALDGFAMGKDRCILMHETSLRRRKGRSST